MSPRLSRCFDKAGLDIKIADADEKFIVTVSLKPGLFARGLLAGQREPSAEARQDRARQPQGLGWAASVGVTLRPCGHRVLCGDCAPLVESCPICRVGRCSQAVPLQSWSSTQWTRASRRFGRGGRLRHAAPGPPPAPGLLPLAPRRALPRALRRALPPEARQDRDSAGAHS